MFLGEDQIQNVEFPLHMGVGLHKYYNQDAGAETRITRARKSFFPMLSIARRGGQTNPVVAS